jgi:hypothetical protein
MSFSDALIRRQAAGPGVGAHGQIFDQISQGIMRARAKRVTAKRTY